MELWPGDKGNNGAATGNFHQLMRLPKLHQGYQPLEFFLNAFIKPIIWMFPKNSSTPKSSILIGFSIINYPFRGTPIFGNTHIFVINSAERALGV